MRADRRKGDRYGLTGFICGCGGKLYMFADDDGGPLFMLAAAAAAGLACQLVVGSVSGVKND